MAFDTDRGQSTAKDPRSGLALLSDDGSRGNYSDHEEQYYDDGEESRTGLGEQLEGARPYIGVALLVAVFFFAAHASSSMVEFASLSSRGAVEKLAMSLGMMSAYQPMSATHAASIALRSESTLIRAGPLTSNTCREHYSGLSLTDIRQGSLPYFLGGGSSRERVDVNSPNWLRFCSTMTGGPICPSVRNLVQTLLDADQRDVLTATPCELWDKVEGRTTWVYGDSQSLDFFKGIVCTLREFVDLRAGPPIPPDREDYGVFKIARPVTGNRTLSKYLYMNRVSTVPPSCVHFVGGTRVCYIRLDKMEQMQKFMESLLPLVKESDIKIVNFGLHHTVGDLAVRLPRLLKKATMNRNFKQNLYFRDTPPQHFDTPYGLYPGKGAKGPFTCKAREGVALQADGTVQFTKVPGLREFPWEVLAKADRRNRKSLPAIHQMGIPVINTYNQTTILHEFHRDNGKGYECSHYCWPVPGLWVHSLLKTLQSTPPQPALGRA